MQVKYADFVELKAGMESFMMPSRPFQLFPLVKLEKKCYHIFVT